uniref:hypothetical protein n=1 Tax=Streptomyces antimycoticus TaxID=68175 RepID=UPI002F917468|nr:hypothetical protein OG546_50330 [Streptomyces antimycoticus]
MNNSFNPELSVSKRRISRLRSWFARRRRTIAAHMLRGACYGLGTGAVGLGFWWIEWWAEHH